MLPTNPSKNPAGNDTNDTSINLNDDEDVPRPFKKIKIIEESASNDYMNSEALEKGPKVSKETRRARAVVSQATLRIVPALPLDILFEIFGYLQPLDLLHIARTTKGFRQLLMRRFASSIWRAAFSNVPGLPPCPPDLSAPSYANLAFDSHCHACLARNVPLIQVFWEHRCRLCKKCAVEMLCSSSLAPEMAACLHMSFMPISTYDLSSALKFPQFHRLLVWSKSELDEVDSNILHLDEPDELGEYKAQKKEEIKQRKSHSEECRKWAETQLVSRHSKRQEILGQRLTAIELNLLGLGYKDLLNAMRNYHPIPTRGLIFLEDHPFVKQPRPLTDHAWDNAKRSLVALMDNWRAHIEAQERESLHLCRRKIVCHLYQHIKVSVAPDDIMPSLADVCAFPRLRAIIERPQKQVAHIEDESTTRRMAKKLITSRLGKMVQRWRNKVLRSLVERLPLDEYEHLMTKDMSVQDCAHFLQLARTVFACNADKECHDVASGFRGLAGGKGAVTKRAPMFWPEFVHHACAKITPRKPTGTNHDPSTGLGPGYEGYIRAPWSAVHFAYDRRASATAARVVGACGLNPDIATVHDMDTLDKRLLCLKCSYGAHPDGDRVFVVWTWRGAVDHCLHKHWGDGTVEFEPISDESAREARVKEFKGAAYRNEVPAWLCEACAETSQEPAKMKFKKALRHVEITHVGWDNVGLLKAKDAPPREPFPVKIKPSVAKER